LAQRWGAELAERGWCVVSGLAHGIDTAAHYGALAVPNGQTVAVLGGGVLNIYPSENRPLAEAVLRRGALLSETHPHMSPSPSALVARNRLISGLSDILIVVETSIDGGAMHAARRAFDQRRAVYTLDSTASGNRALLAEGALPLTPNGPLPDFHRRGE
jgi:DNA processing protein